MADHFALEYQAAIDLSVYHCGTEKCAPGHAYGPAVRDHFLIHFVHNGYGFFQAGGRTYHLGQGQGFLICPGIITYYQADASDPWHYSWVGFQGLKAKGYLETAGLDEDHPVFRYDRDQQVDDYFRAMAAASGMQRGRELQLLGLLYQFLACLIDSREREGTAGRGPDENINRRGLYLGKAQEFISRNYSRRITIGEIARFVGLDRSYLFAIFKEFCHVAPQEYLIEYRIAKACRLMAEKGLTIGDIARSVGYQDPLLFSKTFKRIKGESPRVYRNRMDGQADAKNGY